MQNELNERFADLTAVYMMTGVPSLFKVLQPDQQPAASNLLGVGSSAMGSCAQCTKSALDAWPQHMAQSHSLLPTTCW